MGSEPSAQPERSVHWAKRISFSTRWVNDEDEVGKVIEVKRDNDWVKAEIVERVNGEEEVTVRYDDEKYQVPCTEHSSWFLDGYESCEIDDCELCDGTGIRKIKVSVCDTRVVDIEIPISKRTGKPKKPAR